MPGFSPSFCKVSFMASPLKSLFHIWISLLTFIAVANVASASNVPDEVLNLPIELETGETTTLKDQIGRQPVYLKFWATWCQPCRAQMPHFQGIQQRYGDQLKVIAINIDLNESEKAIQQARDEFGLTMAMAIDKDKTLANGMQLLGTPYHLLFDKQMNLVHVTHEADTALDNKIDMVVQDSPVELLGKQELLTEQPDLALNLDDGKYHVLFFTATWCDWYLRDSRPDYSKKCEQGQRLVNAAAVEHQDLMWHGIVSRLWTGEKDLAEYADKYAIPYENYIDQSSALFLEHAIEQLPTLLVLKDGRVVARLEDFSQKKITKLLDGLAN